VSEFPVTSDGIATCNATRARTLKERGKKRELQTTPNEEGKAKKDHRWRWRKTNFQAWFETGHPFNATH
jgi:hypothetical protein